VLKAVHAGDDELLEEGRRVGGTHDLQIPRKDEVHVIAQVTLHAPAPIKTLYTIMGQRNQCRDQIITLMNIQRLHEMFRATAVALQVPIAGVHRGIHAR
jgi:hypothetical protein